MSDNRPHTPPDGGDATSRPRSITYTLAAPDVPPSPDAPLVVGTAERVQTRPYRRRMVLALIGGLLIAAMGGAIALRYSGRGEMAAQPTHLPLIGEATAGLPTAPPTLAALPTLEPTAAAFVSYYSEAVSRPDRDPDLLPSDPYDQRLSVTYHSRQLNGYWEQAVNDYRAIIADPAAPEAARREAYWRVAQCNFAGGSYGRAIDAYAAFQAAYPDDERSQRAYYIIADAYTYLDNYRPAIPHWQAYLPHSGPLYSFTLLRIGEAQSKLGDYDAARATYSEVVSRPDSNNRERSEAGEGLATIYNLRHDYASELATYESILSMAQDPDYRADVEYRAAVALLRGGNRQAAFDRFRSVITDYPANYRAYGAFQQMKQINPALFDQGLLDYYTAGRLAYAVDSYEEAIGYFAAYVNGAGAAHRADALLYAALSYQTLHNDDRALANYNVIIADHPGEPAATSAHYRIGQLAERRGACSEAISEYAAAAPHLDRDDGRAAALHLGLCRYKLGDYAGASDAWQPLTAATMPPDVRAAADFWLGRDAASTANDPTANYQAAIAAQPGGYYAYRAAAKLAGETASGPIVSPAQRETVDYGAMLVDAAAEEVHQEQYARWLASWAHLPATSTLVVSDLPAHVSLDAARPLLMARVGERIYAKQELDYLLPRLTAADAITLAQMALYYRYIDEPYLSLLTAQRLAALSQQPDPSLPILLRRSLYATPFTDAMIGGADAAHTSPLLLYAIIKQESYYNPLAHSGADARGLAQVLPDTASLIAGGLGDRNFTAYDLYRPYVAARYGAAFLDDQLANAGGSVLRALAAYNAGPGSLPVWSKGAANADADLFVENITFAETAQYVRIVYTNYAAYLELYRQK